MVMNMYAAAVVMNDGSVIPVGNSGYGGDLTNYDNVGNPIDVSSNGGCSSETSGALSFYCLNALRFVIRASIQLDVVVPTWRLCSVSLCDHTRALPNTFTEI